MSTQFSVYMSTDSGSPVLNGGTSGSLVDVFDACLVTGYGSKTPAGWLKPLANSASIGCWRQPSGSQMCLYVHDGAPNPGTTGPAGTAEARVTAWEDIFSLTPPVGAGSGQFPKPEQSNTFGYYAIIKSQTVDLTPRHWIMFADDRTFYFFVYPARTSYTDRYTMTFFGDIYSYNKDPDIYKCHLSANSTDNVNAPVRNQDYLSTIGTAMAGNVIARKATGFHSSILTNACGQVIYTSTPMERGGNWPVPNPTCDCLYLVPLWIFENDGDNSTAFNLRGRYRGMYYLAHNYAYFADGQILFGSGDYAGKVFRVMKYGPGVGINLIEISNTLEQN